MPLPTGSPSANSAASAGSTTAARRSTLPFRLAVAIVAGLAPLSSVDGARAGEVEQLTPASGSPECVDAVIPTWPSWVSGELYGRLDPHLRPTAQAADPIEALAEATRLSLQGSRMAEGCADLAVTGRQVYQRLERLNLSRRDLTQAVVQRVSGFGAAATRQAAERVVTRAYDVAWALRGPVTERTRTRAALGWITVSGEDDRPHRPVNTRSAAYPQRDVGIHAGNQSLTVRVIFIGNDLQDWDASALPDHAFLPRRQPFPRIRGDVLLFLHGHGSSAEEALDFATVLIEEASARGRDLTVVSLDLPGYAYSSSVDTTRMRLPMDSFPNTYPGLSLIEEALDALISTLDAQQPGFRLRVLGTIGGSLGGNLGLRLARRDLRSRASAWAQNIIAWSPASVWPSFADSCHSRSQGIDECDKDVIGAFFGEKDAEREVAVRVTHENASDSFDDSKRGNFFLGGQLQEDAGYAVAERWFPENFGCVHSYLEANKWFVGEYFSAAYSSWHWRIANEQLVYSHWDPSPYSVLGAPSLGELMPKLLLIAGQDDQHSPEFLHENAVRLGSALQKYYGRTLSLANTGHGVASEEPALLADLILDFLDERPPYLSSSLHPVRLEVSGALDDITVRPSRGLRDSEGPGGLCGPLDEFRDLPYGEGATFEGCLVEEGAEVVLGWEDHAVEGCEPSEVVVPVGGFTSPVEVVCTAARFGSRGVDCSRPENHHLASCAQLREAMQLRCLTMSRFEDHERCMREAQLNGEGNSENDLRRWGD